MTQATPAPLNQTGPAIASPWPFPCMAPAEHGGVDASELRALGIDPATIIDFSSNQSPLGVSLAARQAAAAAVLDAYPDRDATELASLIAAYHGLLPGQVVVGNGSTELIRLLAQLALQPDDVALSLAPSFGEYEAATLLARGRFVEQQLAVGEACFAYRHRPFRDALERWQPSLCWLCSPNNPTGAVVPAELIDALVRDNPDTLFVLDEAYVDLLPEPQWTSSTLTAGNLVVLRSMTKVWGLAGLRLGYALADESLAGPLRAAKPPWNVNACAQAAGATVLSDPDRHEDALALLCEGRERLAAQLRSAGWTVLDSAAGFFLIEVGDAALARRRLLAHGCLVRDCTSFGLPEHVRVSPHLPKENDLLLDAFAALAADGWLEGKRR